MIEFNINWARIKLLNATGKDNRMQKLQEEQGELAGAIMIGKVDGIMSETIDVLLMLLSIYADLNPDDDDIQQRSAVQLAEAVAIFSENGMAGSDYNRNYLIIARYIGWLAELNQKIDGVASSNYKMNNGPTVDELKAGRLDRVRWLIGRVWTMLSFTEQSLESIQAEYNRKMDKWEEVTK